MTLLNLPWVLIGDFNAIIGVSECKGGSYHYYSRKANRFSNFIMHNHLLDVNFNGPNYTWYNNQAGLSTA